MKEVLQVTELWRELEAEAEAKGREQGAVTERIDLVIGTLEERRGKLAPHIKERLTRAQCGDGGRAMAGQLLQADTLAAVRDLVAPYATP